MSDATHASHGSVRSYLTGFILAVILTVIPFAVVMGGSVSQGTAVALVVGLGVIQIVVHLRYFLHMGDGSSSESWNMVSFLFTLIVVAILVSGSVWIMYHLNHNMMGPMQMD